MTPQSLGNAFVVTWIMIAVIYDCWVYFACRQPPATISDTLRSWVQWSPLVLIPLGGLLWHLFGVHRGLGPSPWYGWAPILVLIAGMLLYALCGIGSFPNIGPPIE
jgi:cytochrome bd-type quinol oxidase subunit 2